MKKIGYYIVPPVLLIILTVLFYKDSLSYAFQFDDLANITKNFQVRSGSFADLFLLNTRWISQWLNSVYYHLAKFEPTMYRCGNLITHVITGTIVYFVVVMIGSRFKVDHWFFRNRFYLGFLTAGLFLLHPVQTQTVSYIIQGQLEGLAALTCLGMVLCFLLWSLSTTTVTKIWWLAWLIFLALIAPGTKEIAIIGPVLLLLIDWFFVARGNVRSLRSRWWLHAIVWTLIIGMYIYYLKPSYFATIFGLKSELSNNMGNLLTERVGEKITPLWYCMSQFKVIVHYAFIFFWPFTMSVDYDWKLVDSFFALDCLLPFILLCSIAGYVLWRLRKDKTDLIAFCLLWFFIVLLPRSTIIPSTELVADYKTYSASFGLFLLMALGITKFLGFMQKKLRTDHALAHWALLLAMLLPLGVLLHERNKVWRSGLEFWANIIQNAPLKARAYNNYGVSLCEAARFEEAIPNFKRAIALDGVYSDPHNNVAVAYGSLGRIDEAIQALEDSIRIHPMQPEAYNNIASFYLTKGEHAKAHEKLRLALKLRPYYGKAHFNMGRVYSAEGKMEDAWRCFKASCMHGDFDTEFGFFSYGATSAQLKKHDEAIYAFKRFLELIPQGADAQNACGQIARCYIEKKEPRQALIYLEKLSKMLPGDIGVEFQIGQVLYSLKEYEKALEYFKRVHQKNNLFFPVYLHTAETLAALGRKAEGCKMLQDIIVASQQPDMIAMARAKLRQIENNF